MAEFKFKKDELARDLELEAKVLDLESGSSEKIAGLVVDAVEKRIYNKRVITEDDLERMVLTELRKYNKDLAYCYESRNRII